jgi:hypothetical protein
VTNSIILYSIGYLIITASTFLKKGPLLISTIELGKFGNWSAEVNLSGVASYRGDVGLNYFTISACELKLINCVIDLTRNGVALFMTFKLVVSS